MTEKCLRIVLAFLAMTIVGNGDSYMIVIDNWESNKEVISRGSSSMHDKQVGSPLAWSRCSNTNTNTTIKQIQTNIYNSQTNTNKYNYNSQTNTNTTDTANTRSSSVHDQQVAPLTWSNCSNTKLCPFLKFTLGGMSLFDLHTEGYTP